MLGKIHEGGHGGGMNLRVRPTANVEDKTKLDKQDLFPILGSIHNQLNKETTL